MRLNELFATDYDDMLLESYRNFRTAWMSVISDAGYSANQKISTVVSGSLGSRVMELSKMDTIGEVPSFLERILKNNETKTKFRKFHTSGEVALRDSGDINSWIDYLNNIDGVGDNIIREFLFEIFFILRRMKEEEEKKPKYEKVSGSQYYTMFEVYNFSAAQKLRNQVKSTWCIGAAETHFDHYGKDRGRKTYIVFLNKTKRGMVIHVDPRNPDNNLITDHSNEVDGTIRNGVLSPNRGGNGIRVDLNKAMPLEEQTKMFKSAGIRFDPKSSQLKLNPQDMLNFYQSVSRLDSGKAHYSVRGEVDKIIRSYRDSYDSGSLESLKKGIQETLVEIWMLISKYYGRSDSVPSSKPTFVYLCGVLLHFSDHLKDISKNRDLVNELPVDKIWNLFKVSLEMLQPNLSDDFKKNSNDVRKVIIPVSRGLRI